MAVLDHLPLIRRLARTLNSVPERPRRQSLLSPNRFPLAADVYDIVASDGSVVATAVDPVTAQEIVQRLNESDWKRQEDQWAL